jgi:uncharacterized protein
MDSPPTQQRLGSHLDDIIFGSGKKRMLAIDGGGIRGVIAVEVLGEIERILRAHTGNPDLRLADWFHFISGCSTGAIVAAGLSIGMSVDEIRDIYEKSGPAMFRRAGWWTRLIFHKYIHRELAKLMQERFRAETKLGSENVRTLLMTVLKNATTDSPWPLTNNPYAMFNDRKMVGCNLDLPLWQVVRASTAAPTYFAPETILLEGQKRPFVFVDGGLTPYNNPAFLMYLTATLPAYRLGWHPSERDMLVVSVGTGLHPKSAPDLTPRKMHLLYTAKEAPATLMYSAINEQDMLCRAFGKCIAGDHLDMEIGDMIGMPNGAAKEACFTYARYNVDLTESGLDSVGCGDLKEKSLYRLDAVELIHDMQTVGKAVAKTRVRASHFTDFIDAGVGDD